MRRRTAQGLTIAFLVSLGAAQGPHSSGSAKYATVPQALTEAASPSAGIARAGVSANPNQVGPASWSGESLEANPTARGEPYNMYG